MKIKELFEARWLLIIFVALTCVNAIVQTIDTNVADPEHFNDRIWEQWFRLSNGAPMLMALAILLGYSLIVNEVTTGTIFFLLSKPISREHILLEKYGISSFLLLVVALCGALSLEIGSLIVGHPQEIAHLLIAIILLWLGTLSILGLTLMFSIIFHNAIWVLIAAILTTALLTFPSASPDWQRWSLIYYWSDRATYLHGGIPIVAYLVCFLCAIPPLLVGLLLFRRKAY